MFQKVILADAYAAMRDTRGHDCIITDPPYTAHVQANLLSSTINGSVKKVAAGFAPLADYDWVAGAVANTPRWSLFFCALEQLGEYRSADVEHHIRSGIYCKMRAMPQLSGDRPGARCEGVAIFHGDAKKKWNGKGTHAYWLAMPEHRKETEHPTAKPTLLAMRLVELFSDPGETVFDPFAGTGAIGRACALLGRNYIGCDNHEPYVEKANYRIEEALSKRKEWLTRLELYKQKFPTPPAEVEEEGSTK